jgi:hypothetical protein
VSWTFDFQIRLNFPNDLAFNVCRRKLLGISLTQRIWHSEDRASWYILIMKADEMHYFSHLFHKVLYMFRTCPPSIIRSISTLLADVNRTRMTNTYCVYVVLRYSWWWTVDMSEIYRVLYRINLRNGASRWISLYENNLAYSVFAIHDLPCTKSFAKHTARSVGLPWTTSYRVGQHVAKLTRCRHYIVQLACDGWIRNKRQWALSFSYVK